MTFTLLDMAAGRGGLKKPLQREGAGAYPMRDFERDSGGTAGFSLVEALIAVFLSGIMLLSIAMMIGYGVTAHQVSVEISGASSLGEHKMEDLRNTDYLLLVAGGSIVADTAGFFDTQDVDQDGVSDFTRRWSIVDNGTSKVLTVRVIVPRTTLGPAKQATFTSLVANQ